MFQECEFVLFYQRAKSAYLCFTQKARAEVVENNPGKQPKEIMKILGDKWKALSSGDKEEFVELANKDKERYKQEMKAFKEKQSSTDEKPQKMEEDAADGEGDDDDRQPARPTRQKPGFEERKGGDEDVGQIVDDHIEEIAIKLRRVSLHIVVACQRAVDAIDKESHHQP